MMQRLRKNSYIVDDYPGPEIALSLRKLNSNYSGNCIKVRRSSDNSLQDIGFVKDKLNESSLLSFVGAGNDGFIHTWYDQSGNENNISQNTNSLQPKIVSLGTIIKEDNKPIIDFGANTDDWYLLFPSGFIYNITALTYFHVGKIYRWTTLNNAGVFGIWNFYNKGLAILQTGISGRPECVQINGNNRVEVGFWVDNVLSISSFYGNSTEVKAYCNGSEIVMGNSSAMPSLNYDGIYALGRYASSANAMYGKMAEFIIYSSDQSTNRSTIESNINNFYSIY